MRSDGRAVQSQLSQRQAVLADLGIDEDILEVCALPLDLHTMHSRDLIGYVVAEVDRNLPRMVCLSCSQASRECDLESPHSSDGKCVDFRADWSSTNRLERAG